MFCGSKYWVSKLLLRSRDFYLCAWEREIRTDVGAEDDLHGNVEGVLPDNLFAHDVRSASGGKLWVCW